MGYDFEIIVGEHDINDEEDGTRHEVCETTSHPEYNDVTVEYDFAIVRLSKPVNIGLRAMPACLPDKNDQRMAGDALAGETVTVSGWGNPSSNATNQNTLLHVVHVPAMSNQECSQTGYSTYVNPKTGDIEPIEIIDAMLCAGHTEGGIDACQGDSGGPLTYKAAGRTYIVGVVSFGIGCAEAAYPGVYARVTHVRNWIDEQLAKQCPKGYTEMSGTCEFNDPSDEYDYEYLYDNDYAVEDKDECLQICKEKRRSANNASGCYFDNDVGLCIFIKTGLIVGSSGDSGTCWKFD
jgi:secreted trypsin-like serine protease